MNNQVISKSSSRHTEISELNTTNKTTKIRRLRLSAMALCYLAIVIGTAVLPCQAETITSGSFGYGTVNVTTPSGNSGWNWAGSPQTNPDLITVNQTSAPYGAFGINLNFTQDPSTEYGITWNMTNNSGFDWYSMHFTIQFAPLGDFNVTFDKTGANPSTPNTNVVGWGLDNWSDTKVDFSGGASNGVNGTATFNLPLDVYGRCCSGNLIVWATPDYNPSTPEPNTMLLLGSGILGVGGILRKRFLG